MNEQTYEALKRVIEKVYNDWLEQRESGKMPQVDPSYIDIDMVRAWIDETAKEHEEVK